ncbi:MAG: hypothetical protein Q9180_003334, partial [Flavoplaca navasiana]
MFVKLPTIVLVAVTATLSLGAPTPEGDGLSLREANPQIEGYPNCGAPICKRDGDIASSEDILKRDVLTAEATALDLTNQTPQIDCQKRLGCPPWGHPEKRQNRCLCINNKKAMLERDVQADQASQVDQTAQVEQ